MLAPPLYLVSFLTVANLEPHSRHPVSWLKTIWNNLELNLPTSVGEIPVWHWNHIHRRLLLSHTGNIYFHFLRRSCLGFPFRILIFEQLFDWSLPITSKLFLRLFLRWRTQIKHPSLGLWILSSLKIAENPLIFIRSVC